MSTIVEIPETRVVRDHDGRIRSIFEFGGVSPIEGHFDPEEIAQRLLDENLGLFDWPAPDCTLRPAAHRESSYGHSVDFIQEYRDAPVAASAVTVNMTTDGQPYAVYNDFHYDIPDYLDPGAIEVDDEGPQIAERIQVDFAPLHEVVEIERGPSLTIYRHEVEQIDPKDLVKQPSHKPEGFELLGEEGVYYLAWEALVITQWPDREWRVLISADTHEYIDVQDMVSYATGKGKVFDPDPVTASGDTKMSFLKGKAADRDKYLKSVDLPNLNTADAQGYYRLDGKWVNMQELGGPVEAEPKVKPAAGKLPEFIYGSEKGGFRDTMVYYHIDRFQTYLQGLGFKKVVNYSIAADAEGLDGDNSGCSGGFYNKPCTLRFGQGKGKYKVEANVPDAEDANVILHEYGHAIHRSYSLNPGDGINEGLGDSLAAIYHHDKHKDASKTVGMTFPWDANLPDVKERYEVHGGTKYYWDGRRYDRAWKFGGPEATGMYEKGELWASTMFEIYRKLGGDSTWLGDRHSSRDLVIKLEIDAILGVNSSSQTALKIAQEMEKADKNLKNWHGHKSGLHGKVIYDAFHGRDLAGFKDKITPISNVDVYVDDGRKGGYGWLQSPWKPKDVWTRLQKDGDKNDTHEEPKPGKPAYLYVRVRNRGSEKAQSVTVKAFHSAPAVGLVWPAHFTAIKSVTVKDVLPDSQEPKGMVVGPFEWTPTASSGGCVLVILECDQDKALTQTQTAIMQGPVNTVHLARFDNNIVQRNLSPVPNTGSPKREFFLANPSEEVTSVDLVVTSTLPDNWELSFGLPELHGIRLGPLERRPVEFEVIIPPEGETVDLEDPPRLSFEGLVEDRSIGGLDFYFAPPETFGWPREGEFPAEILPRDLIGLGIPWEELDIEGTLELRIQFRSRK